MLTRIKPPVLFVHGSNDKRIDIKDSISGFKVIPGSDFEMIEGADHIYSNHQLQVANTITDWVRRNFQLES